MVIDFGNQRIKSFENYLKKSLGLLIQIDSAVMNNDADLAYKQFCVQNIQAKDIF